MGTEGGFAFLEKIFLPFLGEGEVPARITEKPFRHAGSGSLCCLDSMPELK